MTLNEFFAAAERYANLGGAVQRQLQRIYEKPDLDSFENTNSNALSMIKDFLGYLGELYEDEALGAEAFEVLVTIDEAEDELKNLDAPPEFEP